MIVCRDVVFNEHQFPLLKFDDNNIKIYEDDFKSLGRQAEKICEDDSKELKDVQKLVALSNSEQQGENKEEQGAASLTTFLRSN